MKNYLLLIFACCACVLHAGNPDSLLKVAEGRAHDTAYVLLVMKAAGFLDDAGQYEKAISLCQHAKRTSDSLHFKFGMQSALNIMGNCYIDKGDVKKALECHLQVLKLREEMGLKKGIGYTNLNLGNIYFRLGENENALKSYTRCMEILGSVGDSTGVATSLANSASIYSNMAQPQKAEEYFLRSLGIRQRMGNTDGIAEIYSNLSVVFMDNHQYKKALEYAFKTLDLYGEEGNKLGKAISYSNIGDIYEHMNDYTNAIKYQEIALNMGKEMKSLFMMQIAYQLLAVVHAKKGDYKNALYNYEMYSHTTDSMMNSENSKLIAEMQTQFETEKKQKEIELLQKDNSIRELQISEQAANINRQRMVIYSVVGGLVLIVVLVFYIFKSYREKKKINEGLEKKNHEINEQRNQIGEKNQLITDSIDYAKSIQQAILPSDETISRILPGSFVLFAPKDIVSGDFYWVREIEKEKVLVACVDCTGHGVPGAFMSVMAFNMLENIVADKKLVQPSLILDKLNSLVRETLHQESETTSAKYGMDISLILLDRKDQKIQFSGAHNSLCLVRKGELSELKADKTTIGMAREKFLNYEISVQKNDMLYMFTDGYADQKGGIDNKKIFATDLKKMLLAISQKEVADQKEVLLANFNKYKGAKEQIDDVLMIGIRV